MKKNTTEYEKFGFKRSDITEILGSDFFTKTTEQLAPTVNAPQESKNCEIAGKEITEIQSPNEWAKKFADRKNALEIISALSLLIVEKSGNKHRRGNGISASSIATEVVGMLPSSPDPQKYRKLISEALKETQSAAHGQL